MQNTITMPTVILNTHKVSLNTHKVILNLFQDLSADKDKTRLAVRC